MAAQTPEDLSRLFVERASANDLDGLMELYEPGARFIGPNGGDADGEEAIRERLRDLLAMKPSIVSTDVRAVRVGDVALLSNRWQMSFGNGTRGSARIDGTSTEVARRQPDGCWRLVIDDPASAGLSSTEPLSVSTGSSDFERLTYEEDGPDPVCGGTGA